VSDASEGERESTWARLKRRKVVQWGIAYAAGVWGFLQGLEYISATYDWPRQIQQLVTLGLLIGLPVVLVLAWYHGDRGQQRVTTTEIAVLTLLLLLGSGAFWYYQRASEGGGGAAPTTAAPQPRRRRRAAPSPPATVPPSTRARAPSAPGRSADSAS